MTDQEPEPGVEPRPAAVTVQEPEPGVEPRPAPAPASVEKRPWIERLGLAAIALVMGALLIVMAAAAWVGGEGILAAMSASGAILTIGVGLLTLIRG